VNAVAPREAATVVLLRDTPDGLQTWLMRRMPMMAFAAGMSVFPGGAVDEQDGIFGGGAQGLDAVAQQLQTTTGHAGALLCAAIRETFEEAGVLLATPRVTVAWADRAAVENRERTFASLLSELAVELDLLAVRPWSRWITPEGGARRYDTYFFVAVLPSELTAAAVTSEASHADWIGVSAALAEHAAGNLPMLLPTITTLSQLGEYRDTEQVLAAARQRVVAPVAPVFARNADGAWVADLGDGNKVLMGDEPAETIVSRPR
jgi:8-oxo-dGTP pyrophosphatase MutT (NUDIX family)